MQYTFLFGWHFAVSAWHQPIRRRTANTTSPEFWIPFPTATTHRLKFFFFSFLFLYYFLHARRRGVYSNFLGKCECNFAFFFPYIFWLLTFDKPHWFFECKVCAFGVVLLQRLLYVKREWFLLHCNRERKNLHLQNLCYRFIFFWYVFFPRTETTKQFGTELLAQILL